MKTIIDKALTTIKDNPKAKWPGVFVFLCAALIALAGPARLVLTRVFQWQDDQEFLASEDALEPSSIANSVINGELTIVWNYRADGIDCFASKSACQAGGSIQIDSSEWAQGKCLERQGIYYCPVYEGSNVIKVVSNENQQIAISDRDRVDQYYQCKLGNC